MLVCWTSVNNSEAAVLCLKSGWARGDSKRGSIGSKGLIKCASTQSLGSATSSTLNGPGEVAVRSAEVVVGDGVGSWNEAYMLSINYVIYS